MANNFFINQYKKNTNSDNSKKDNETVNIQGEQKTVKKFVFKKLEEVAPIPEKPVVQKSNVDSLGVLSKMKMAAILLIVTDRDTSSKIIRSFNEQEIIKVSTEILQIESISADDLKQVEKKFGPQNVENLSEMKGTKEFLRLLLQRSFGIQKGSELFLKVLENTDDKNFTFLENVPPEKILQITKDESPLIIAIMLSKLKPQQSGEILKKLDPQCMSKVVMSIAKQTQINSDTLDIIAKKIKEKAKAVMNNQNGEKVSGKNILIDILKHSSSSDAQNILNQLNDDDPELADEIRDSLFTFNDIPTLKKSDLELALKDYSNNDIAFMLKGTEQEIRKAFFEAVSKHRAILIVDEMKALGEVKKSDVEKLQHDFVDYLRQLESEGTIILHPDNETYVN